MVETTKKISFYAKIEEIILKNWKETITQNEKINKRLEEAIVDNTNKHLKLKFN